MKLLWKFSLIFALVFGLGMSIVGWICYRFLQRNAKAEVIEQAQLIMQAASAVREYTDEEVAPLLAKCAMPGAPFAKAQVPTVATLEVTRRMLSKMRDVLGEDYMGYVYKDAALRPVNSANKADDCWEVPLIKRLEDMGGRSKDAAGKNYVTPEYAGVCGPPWFPHGCGADTFVGERSNWPNITQLALARGIPIDRVDCLRCHGDLAEVRKDMLEVAEYKNGSFNWKKNTIPAAQIVYVPVRIPEQRAMATFKSLVLSLMVAAGLTLLVLNMALVYIVLRPVTRLAATADQISKGNLDLPELPVRGKDEIASMAASFNRMYGSLARAIKMLNESPPESGGDTS